MQKPYYIFLYIFGLLALSSCTKTFTNEEYPSSSTESYVIEFHSLWNPDSGHNFEKFPSSAHFSPPVVVSHNKAVEFWKEGELASKGVERIAEIGRTREFGKEVRVANENGMVLQFEREGSFDWDETESMLIKVSDEFHFISVLSMIAPSPDWFVGLNGLDMKDEDGRWKDYVECQLLGYDAGTEEGTSYDLDNLESNPLQKIHKLSDDVSLKARGIILQEPYLLLKIKRVGSTEEVPSDC